LVIALPQTPLGTVFPRPIAGFGRRERGGRRREKIERN